jgi:hypothetical protein
VPPHAGLRILGRIEEDLPGIGGDGGRAAERETEEEAGGKQAEESEIHGNVSVAWS